MDKGHIRSEANGIEQIGDHVEVVVTTNEGSGRERTIRGEVVSARGAPSVGSIDIRADHEFSEVGATVITFVVDHEDADNYIWVDTTECKAKSIVYESDDPMSKYKCGRSRQRERRIGPVESIEVTPKASAEA